MSESRRHLPDAHRIVVKLGTHVVTHDGVELAVGQGHLMGVYTQAFAQLGVKTAQVLLTQEDLADRDRALCLRTTLMRLLELGTVPVLNENDSVSVRELVEHQRRGEG